jgi:hypothetical protein
MTRKRRNKNTKLLIQKIRIKSCKTKKYNSVYGGRMPRALFF